jgi:sugar phosphate isomerase/epimerase
MFTSFNPRAVGLRLPTHDVVGLAAAAGFEGVDLMVRDLVDDGVDPQSLRARMDALGLRGGAFPLPVDWRGERALFDRDLARLPALAEAAAVLGLRWTGTWVMPETPGRFEDPREQARHRAETVALHVERLGRIARALGPFGIRLGLEVIGVASFRTGRGEPFVTRLADLGPLLASVRREADNVGVLVDAFHLYAAGEPVEAGLAWGGGVVVWVHVADLPAAAPADRGGIRDHDRGLPGEHGAVPSRRLLARLLEEGYDGPVTAEPLAGCRALAELSAEQVARRVAGAVRSVWPAGGS